MPILSVNFIGTLGFSIVLPFLVFLVTRWGGNALVYGVMGATYSAFQLIGAPVLGRWSDRVGRRRILLLSQMGTLLSWVVFIVAFYLPETSLFAVDHPVLGSFTLTLPLAVLFLARAADGITGGNVSVANAYLADITPEPERNRNFGRMAVAANLGFIVGPSLGGLLGASAWGELGPVLAAAGISAVATLIIAYRLPDIGCGSLRSDPEHTNVRKVFGQETKECFQMKAAATLPLSVLLRLPGISVLMSMYFLVMLGFNFFYVAFPVHAVGVMGWSITDTGLFFAVLSGLLVLVQGPILGRLSRSRGERTLIIVGSLILAPSFLLYLFTAKPLVFAGAALMALGNGLMWPSLVSMLSKVAGDTYQGAVQGFAGSAGAVASIVGLVAGGVLYDRMAESIFLVAAFSIALVFALSMRLPVVAGRPDARNAS